MTMNSMLPYCFILISLLSLSQAVLAGKEPLTESEERPETTLKWPQPQPSYRPKIEEWVHSAKTTTMPDWWKNHTDISWKLVRRFRSLGKRYPREALTYMHLKGLWEDQAAKMGAMLDSLKAYPDADPHLLIELQGELSKLHITQRLSLNSWLRYALLSARAFGYPYKGSEDPLFITNETSLTTPYDPFFKQTILWNELFQFKHAHIQERKAVLSLLRLPDESLESFDTLFKKSLFYPILGTSEIGLATLLEAILHQVYCIGIGTEGVNVHGHRIGPIVFAQHDIGHALAPIDPFRDKFLQTIMHQIEPESIYVSGDIHNQLKLEALLCRTKCKNALDRILICLFNDAFSKVLPHYGLEMARRFLMGYFLFKHELFDYDEHFLSRADLVAFFELRIRDALKALKTDFKDNKQDKAFEDQFDTDPMTGDSALSDEEILERVPTFYFTKAFCFDCTKELDPSRSIEGDWRRWVRREDLQVIRNQGLIRIKGLNESYAPSSVPFNTFRARLKNIQADTDLLAMLGIHVPFPPFETIARPKRPKEAARYMHEINKQAYLVSLDWAKIMKYLIQLPRGESGDSLAKRYHDFRFKCEDALSRRFNLHHYESSHWSSFNDVSASSSPSSLEGAPSVDQPPSSSNEVNAPSHTPNASIGSPPSPLDPAASASAAQGSDTSESSQDNAPGVSDSSSPEKFTLSSQSQGQAMNKPSSPNSEDAQFMDPRLNRIFNEIFQLKVHIFDTLSEIQFAESRVDEFHCLEHKARREAELMGMRRMKRDLSCMQKTAQHLYDMRDAFIQPNASPLGCVLSCDPKAPEAATESTQESSPIASDPSAAHALIASSQPEATALLGSTPAPAAAQYLEPGLNNAWQKITQLDSRILDLITGLTSVKNRLGQHQCLTHRAQKDLELKAVERLRVELIDMRTRAQQLAKP